MTTNLCTSNDVSKMYLEEKLLVRHKKAAT